MKSAIALVGESSVSLRQLQYWVRRGWLKAISDPYQTMQFSDNEARIALIAAELVFELAMHPRRACMAARNLVESPYKRHVIDIGDCGRLIIWDEQKGSE